MLSAAWLAAAACGGDAISPPAPPPLIWPTTVSLGPTGRVLAVGDSLQFVATSNLGAVSWRWSVDHPELARISQSGLVHALAAGAVQVTVCVSGGSVCGTAALTVAQ